MFSSRIISLGSFDLFWSEGRSGKSPALTVSTLNFNTKKRAEQRVNNLPEFQNYLRSYYNFVDIPLMSKTQVCSCFIGDNKPTATLQ